MSVLVAFKKVLSVKGLSATRYAANQFRRVMAQLMSPQVLSSSEGLARFTLITHMNGISLLCPTHSPSDGCVFDGCAGGWDC